MTAAPNIFLSYNREDQATAQRFAEAFEREGLSVWWDVTLRSGETYDKVTEEALRAAKAVVVLWSLRSVESRWVRAEATVADRNRTLVPARIEACDLPIMFELTQTADLSHWSGNTTDPGWRAFRTDVQRLVEAGAEAPPAHRESEVAPAAKPPSRGTGPSIAILPFINRSGVTEDDVFANGMAEDITVALSLSRRMKVIASSATMAYRTGARDVRQIGHDLGVRYLLEGNIRRVGDDLRVTAQLVEAEDGDILWTQKFDRPLAQVSALQEELVTDVAAYLGVEVQRAEMAHALRKPGDINAWEAVLRADANISRQTLAGYEAAVVEARRAVEIDPGYDLAHATLAMALGVISAMCRDHDPALVQEVLDAVARARGFDSNDPIVLARIASGLNAVGRFRDALPFAERAVSINPNLDIAQIALSVILIALGRWDEAIAAAEAAEQIAPKGIWLPGSYLWRAVAYLNADNVDLSLEFAERSLHCLPNYQGQVHKMICLAKIGRWNEARDAMRTFREANPELSYPVLEKPLRSGIYSGLSAERSDEILALIGKLWNEVATEGGSQ
jgi:TolB-like protein